MPTPIELTFEKEERFIKKNWAGFYARFLEEHYRDVYHVGYCHIDFKYSGYGTISMLVIVFETVDPYHKDANGKHRMFIPISNYLNWKGSIKLVRFAKGLNPEGVENE